MSTERQDEILRFLDKQGHISVLQLSRELHVSEPTVRRDLSQMEKQGLLTRTRGGASSNIRGSMMPFMLRNIQQLTEKQEIARMALPLIKEGMTVFLDAGTTARQLFPLLRGDMHITVVTNAVSACSILTEKQIPAYCIGGHIDPRDDAVRGSYAENFLRQMHFDLSFFSCSGLSNEGLLTGFSEEGVSMLRTLIAQSSRRAYLIVSHSIGTEFKHVVCSVADLDYVISEKPLPENIRNMVGANRRPGTIGL